MSKASRTLLVAILCVFALSANAAETKKLMRLVQPGIQLPKGVFFDGKKAISLDAFQGNYVLLNFWATWCAPCIKEMPALDRLAGKLVNQNFIVVAVSQDEGGPSLVRPFVEKLKISNLRVIYDQDKRSFREYALRGLPTTVLISPDGKIIARLEGGADWDEGDLFKQIHREINRKN